MVMPPTVVDIAGTLTGSAELVQLSQHPQYWTCCADVAQFACLGLVGSPTSSAMQTIIIVPSSMRFSQVPAARTCKGTGSDMSAGAGTGRKGKACAA